ncbi:MAG: zinc-binding dehydrogenase [Deltaproteobacteria bacterium]|nr:zinc-binding dehydrogenase [Deltaproteobacteria bacterium]
MQKIQIDAAGGYERLRLVEVASPPLRPGQVRVAVRAIGVNFADCAVRMGLYASAKRYVGWPITPGFEVAGTVAEIAPDVADFRVGEPVLALSRFGAYASEVAVPATQVVRYPAAWTPEQAAGFAVPYLTAWYGLCHLAGARRGQVLLVHSAAGGVGQALVQLGKALGCKVIGVVRGAHKLAPVRALGCDAVIDKGAENWLAAVKEAAPDGVDIALDANGVETLGDSYRLLAPAGKLVVYGFATMLSRGGNGRPNWLKLAWTWLRTPRFNPLDLTTENKSVLAFNLSFLFDKTEVLAEALQFLLPLAEAGALKPLATRTFALAQAGEAQRELETGATVGKLVLTVGQ